MTFYFWVATAICLTGTAINVKRVNWCFVLWAIGEIMWLAYDIGAGMTARAILDFVGLALAIWGAWENLIKKRISK